MFLLVSPTLFFNIVGSDIHLLSSEEMKLILLSLHPFRRTSSAGNRRIVPGGYPLDSGRPNM